jgi:AcrR family transcriptional regulator
MSEKSASFNTIPHSKQQAALRERQIAARLDQILDAAARLFAERGFHRTTTRDIAEAAQVSEGTLYNYFDNKNDLLFGILERLSESEGVEDSLQMQASDDARTFVDEMLHRRQDFLQKNAIMLQAILSEILANEELRQRYAQQIMGPSLAAVELNLRQRASLGQTRPLDAPAAARILTSLWIGMFFLDILGDPLVHSDSIRLVDATTDIIFDGIAPQ